MRASKGETGAMVWNELMTTDRAAATEFYRATLGLDRFQVPESTMDYTMLKAGETEVAGVMQITPDMGEFPPYWGVYFGIDNVDASVEQAKSLGASVHVPRTDIAPFEGQPPVGRFAFLGDPQGTAFGIFQPIT